MEIHQLRYFLAVAEEGSFSRAAAREHVAQPSLSQQIQKLEAELDQRLFDRLPRSVVITEAGKCFLEYARKILVEIAEAPVASTTEPTSPAGDHRILPTMRPSFAELIGKFQAATEVDWKSWRTQPQDSLSAGGRNARRRNLSPATKAQLGISSVAKNALLLLPKQHRLAKKKRSLERSQIGKVLLLHEVHCLSPRL